MCLKLPRNAICLVVSAVGIAMHVLLAFKAPYYWLGAVVSLAGLQWLFDYRAKKRIFSMLCTTGYSEINDGHSTTYTGIYRPNWEFCHVLVPRSNRSVFGIPIVEVWLPQFIGHLPNVDGLQLPLAEFKSTFVGTPSKCTQSYIGEATHRIVEIASVVELDLVTKPSNIN